MEVSKRVKDRMQVFLEETVKHYNLGNRSLWNDVCAYVPEDCGKSEGCAIGRKLPKSYRKKLMSDQFSKYNHASIVELFDNMGIPKYFKGMPIDFLTFVQILHDDEREWGENGLISRTNLDIIINKHNLKPIQ